jgi:predicted nucleic acid-binding protein
MKRSMETEPARLFIDTWGWLVLADAEDPAHKETAAARRSHRAFLTTDYVLDETITRLFSRCPFSLAQVFCEGIFDARQAGVLSVEPITPARFAKAWKFRMKYRDKPQISFTDLTSFVVMEELRIHHVLTSDSHFTKVHLGFRVLP